MKEASDAARRPYFMLYSFSSIQNPENKNQNKSILEIFLIIRTQDFSRCQLSSKESIWKSLSG